MKRVDFRLDRSLAFALFLSCAALFLHVTGAHAASGNTLLKNMDVSGLTSDGSTFEGSLTITELSMNEAGELVADGILRGSAAGQSVRQSFSGVAADFTSGGDSGVCDILFLDIGPIFLDILGLRVQLSRITLDIDAVPGPGNLLGNLLCALVGLLDNFSLDDVLSGILGNLLDGINEIL